MSLNHGWALMSSAPRLDPRRLSGFLINSWEMKSLHSGEIAGFWGTASGTRRTFSKVSSRRCPRNGVTPKSSSNVRIPSAHQSTSDPWPVPLMTSGARYSSVPTKELDLPSGSATRRYFSKVRLSLFPLPQPDCPELACDTVFSMRGVVTALAKDRSKSVRTTWPLPWRRMFSGLRSLWMSPSPWRKLRPLSTCWAMAWRRGRLKYRSSPLSLLYFWNS
mmetsp:Transcript_22157/g.53017  ORF Transcript_22157/g.53017 Transcript_22157/m.53017 type:complete len:219 (+) Transcript_22157:656-1312(+)